MEHLWDTLDQSVRQRNPPTQALPQHFTALQQEWKNIPQLVVQYFIASMHRHCLVVIRTHTNTDFFPIPMTHICLCTCFRWIARYTVWTMYRANPFLWHHDIWLLVSCLPVLLLNFVNQCQVSFLRLCMYVWMDGWMSGWVDVCVCESTTKRGSWS